MPLDTLKARLGEVIDLYGAVALLHWDQEVYMPPKAAAARGRQLATLSALAHRRFTAPETGDLIAGLLDEAAALDPDAAALVREAHYDYQRAVCLPEAWVQRFAVAQSAAYESWVKARAAASFKDFAPHLETLRGLLLEKAEYLGYEGTPYDALIEDHERGITSAELKTLFSTLAEKQRVLLAKILAAPRQEDFGWLEQAWPGEAQWAVSLDVLKDMGFDFEAGRMDKSVHPFTTNFDLYDVRITTRISEEEPFSCLMGSIHEGGHALYEQGFLPEDQGTLLAQAPSLGIHESQSRLWENMIGRSRAFWTHYLPLLRAHFPEQLKGVSLEQVYRAVNRVAPSYIRTEADECTYNLHVILRFEVEAALIEGAIEVADIPALWNEKLQHYLGLDAPSDALGCLQDIHWSHGSLGYFPTYTLGNLYAAQLFAAMEAALPNLWVEVAEGRFGGILGWLRRHVHEAGRRKTATEIVTEASGKAPGVEDYLAYLEKKYGALYGG